MSFFDKQDFLIALIDRTEVITSNTKSFFRLSNDQLNYKSSANIWSIAEIFEHLFTINKIYNDQISKRINLSPDAGQLHFQSGWLGDWVYEKLMPRADGSVYKIRSPKTYHSSTPDSNGHEVLNRFLEQQDVMHDILKHASTKNLDRITIPFYFSKLLKFRLGDTLRFIVAHNERHLMQANRVSKEMLALQNG